MKHTRFFFTFCFFLLQLTVVFGESRKPLTPHEFFRYKRLPPGDSKIPMDRYFAAKEHMKKMPRYSSKLGTFLPSRVEMKASSDFSPLSLGTWTSLGPTNKAGRTRSLVIDPTASKMYAAGVGGGIWKTTSGNGGSTWAPWQALDDFMASLAVNCLAMDPNNSNVLYAGTGELYLEPDQVRGAGIFKTTDGGNNWSQISSTNNSNFQNVYDIVVSPVNSQRVYATTPAGIFRSTNGGTNWTNVLSSSTANQGCQDLAIRTDVASDYVFAACGHNSQFKIYRNTAAEQGTSWNSVLTDGSMGRSSIGIGGPANQNTIYVLSAKIDTDEGSLFNGGLLKVFRSTDGGSNWTTQYSNNNNTTTLNNLLLSDPYSALCLGANSQIVNEGFNANVIAVDPTNPDIVWVGGVDLFRSNNGGVSWGLASFGSAKPAAQYAHSGHHIVRFHPNYNGTSNQTIFFATDGGIFRTNNALASTATGSTAPCDPDNANVTFTELNDNYVTAQFYHGLPYPDGSGYFGGTEGNGTLRHLEGIDASGEWSEILNGNTGGYVAIDPTNTDIIYAENTGMSIQKSTNGGISFTPISSANDLDDTGGHIVPFIIDPFNNQTLWTGGQKHVWRSSDGGNSWDQASDSSTGTGFMSAIAVSPLNPAKVVAGKDFGFVLQCGGSPSCNDALTSDSTNFWPRDQIRLGFVSSIAFDPTDDDVMYVTYATFKKTARDYHVYKTSNFGNLWTQLDGTGANKIPDIPVNSIVVHPNNPSLLYVGTDLGIFVSTDGGLNWNIENTGFANVPTERLAFNISGGHLLLYAFTHGRGAWRVDLGVIPTPPDVFITSPSNGSTVSGIIDIDATANDDDQVDRVEFYFDNALIDTDLTEPYSTSFDTTSVSNGGHLVKAKAFDNDNNSSIASVNITVTNVGAALFFDDFVDPAISGWSIQKGNWTQTASYITSTTDSKADIFANMPSPFTGCTICTIEADLELNTAGGRISLFGWYQSKSNSVELILMDDKGKWILKQKGNGDSVKSSALQDFTPGTTYHVKLLFDGTKFQLYVDNVSVIDSMTPVAPPGGTVGFRVKSKSGNVTARFHQILVY